MFYHLINYNDVIFSCDVTLKTCDNCRNQFFALFLSHKLDLLYIIYFLPTEKGLKPAPFHLIHFAVFFLYRAVTVECNYV